MKLIVTGGRDYSDQTTLDAVLNRIHQGFDPIRVLVHGGANGADAMAGAWAARRNIPVVEFRARWKLLGGIAGPARNQQMLEGNLDATLLVFPGGSGTEDCWKRAHRLGLRMMFAEDVAKGLKNDQRV